MSAKHVTWLGGSRVESNKQGKVCDKAKCVQARYGGPPGRPVNQRLDSPLSGIAVTCT